MPSLIFQRAETKARCLFDELNQRLQDPSTEDAVYDPIEQNYSVEALPPESALGFLQDWVLDVLRDENVGLEDWQLANIRSTAQTDIAYANYFNLAEGSILCS
jgi:hypothetical protein